tara:strand:- start:85 stop:981 length:897 start_codon:yes stop_codon:yes gene_type:complete
VQTRQSSRIIIIGLATAMVALLGACADGASEDADTAAGTATGDRAVAADQPSGPSDAVRRRITTEYTAYVLDEADAFLAASDAFADAVIAGDVETARELYAPARMHFERIEPIAEALGDFDPRLDAREGDVPDEEWRGYHRLEKLLWVEGTAAERQHYAALLKEDVALLRGRLETVEVAIPDLVTGTIELLNEISSSKVTGEEERYSHTDLWDFAANLQGSYEIFTLLKTHLDSADHRLATTIESRFNAVFETLSSLERGDGYLLYTELDEEHVRTLSAQIDAVAEPLATIGTYFPES